MRNQLVYDLPLRLFHWLFAALFVVAFLIAKTVDDESAVFSYHMLAGLLLGFIVCLRLIWGVVGTRHARFSGFALHPQDLLKYLKGIVSGDQKRWSGHNPASSWAAILMFALALGLGLTGYLMASGQKETFEDVHEVLANGFLVVVLLHIAGVVLHALRHQDGIALSMVDGAKEDLGTAGAIQSSRPMVALIFVALVAGFGAYLAKNFNRQNQTLHFFGQQLQLGENEGAEGDEKQESKKKVDVQQDDDGDDD